MEQSSENSSKGYLTEEEMTQLCNKVFEGSGIKVIPPTEQPEATDNSGKEVYQITFLPKRQSEQKKKGTKRAKK